VQAVTSWSKNIWAALLATTVVVALPATAQANNGGGGAVEGGNPGGGDGRGSSASANGQNLTATVTHTKIRISAPGGGKSVSTGNITSIDPNWEPPACWYEPVMTPAQLKSGTEASLKSGEMVAVNAHEWWSPELIVDHYKDGKYDGEPGYHDYNMGKDGMWWRSVVRAGHEQDIKAWDCDKIMFWEDRGQVPDVPHAISPKILAEYAYSSVKVPDTKVEMSPNARQTVNLPTWVWLDKGKFEPVSVTASIPEIGLSATVTAKPVSLHIDPGTSDATLFPTSGDCPISHDGSIGTPWKKGDKGDPPCGLTYLRSTSGGSYPFKATLTWKITWMGSDGTKGDLPDGTFGTTTDVTVQEVQTVNR
jgi:hypothetical protein